jgi:hypothetical protein
VNGHAELCVDFEPALDLARGHNEDETTTGF